MYHSYSFEVFGLVVSALLLHSSYSAAVQKPSESNMDPKKAPVHNHSDTSNTTEFYMESESYTHFMQINSGKKELLSVHVSHVDFNYDLTCPEKVSSDGNGPVNTRSTCPWYYSVHQDAKRYPATILNAERLCEYAIGSNKSLECTPITQYVSVLKLQGYQNETDNYIWANENVTVVIGYTAAVRRSAYNFAASKTTVAPNGMPTPEFF